LLIKFDKRCFNKEGIFVVKIVTAKLHYFSDARKNYYEFRFENDSNYTVCRIPTNKTFFWVDIIFKSVGCKRDVFDENLGNLIGKELSVKICQNKRECPENFLIVEYFYNIKEFREKEFNWSSLNEEIHYDDNSASLEEVFGIDKEDLAREMGKDPSEISDSDYWEGMGY